MNLLESVPPHDEDAELGVLGAMFDAQAAPVAVECLKAEDFYLPRHRTLFKALCDLFAQQENLDEIFVCSELKRRNQLEAVGGRDYIGRLVLRSSPASIEGYCQIVRDFAIRRDLASQASKTLQSIGNSGLSGQALLEQAEKGIYDIADRRQSSEPTDMADLLTEIEAEVDYGVQCRNRGVPLPTRAIASHFPDLDHTLAGGFWPGELAIICGRPSMGKTTFAINIVRKVVLGREPHACAIFSLEMGKQQIAKNIVCAQGAIDGWRMRKNQLEDEDFHNLKMATKALKSAPVVIDDAAGLSVPQIRAKCRRLKHRKGLKLIVIDYLQLMRAVEKHGSREQEVAELSGGLKALAKELDIAVLCLSQLNRSAEKRENEEKRPQLSDLRDSGAIEQDADVVIGLYRPGYYNLEMNQKNENLGEACILKNRNGAVGKVNLTFLKNILRFESYTPGPVLAS